MFMVIVVVADVVSGDVVDGGLSWDVQGSWVPWNCQGDCFVLTSLWKLQKSLLSLMITFEGHWKRIMRIWGLLVLCPSAFKLWNWAQRACSGVSWVMNNNEFKVPAFLLFPTFSNHVSINKIRVHLLLGCNYWILFSLSFTSLFNFELLVILFCRGSNGSEWWLLWNVSRLCFSDCCCLQR